MKIAILTSILFCLAAAAKGQTNRPSDIPGLGQPDSKAKSDTTNYDLGDHVAKFPGGMDKFMAFIKEKFKRSHNDDEVHGTVIASFVIDKDGNLTQIKIISGISRSIDNDLVTILESSPKWKPGMQRGKPVRLSYSVPIHLPF